MKSRANLIGRSSQSDEAECKHMSGMVMWLLAAWDSRDDLRHPIQVTKQLGMTLALLALSCTLESLEEIVRSLIRPRDGRLEALDNKQGLGQAMPSSTTCMLCLEYLAEEAAKLIKIGAGQTWCFNSQQCLFQGSFALVLNQGHSPQVVMKIRSAGQRRSRLL